MSHTVIALPDRDELARRLTSVNNEQHRVDRFHPEILVIAGHKLTGIGVANTLSIAASDYVEGMPPIMLSVLLGELPDYVRAIVDDPDVQREAIEHLVAVTSAS